MSCFAPLKGYRSIERTDAGKRSLVFSRREGYSDLPVEVPCGQCIGCRKEKSRQWAIRCMHEAELHDENCFITLTYNDDSLPPLGSLRKRDFQLFMKRLRKSVAPRKVRFFHSGEYGESTCRPHYHAILFGFDFRDKYHWSDRNGYEVFRSPFLERIWPHGNSEIGSVTFDSAAYVAKYCVKKLTGPEADAYYVRLDYETGELVPVEPEYATMSRRPGIGAGWYERYGEETHRLDSVVFEGKEMRPPKYYDGLADNVRPEVMRKNRLRRQAEINEEEQSPERLTAREDVALHKQYIFNRNSDL